MPDTIEHLETGDALLEILAACRMLKRHLGYRASVDHRGVSGFVLTGAPDSRGYVRLELFRAEDVLAWYRKVAEGPTLWSRYLPSAMREHEHMLRRPF